MRTESLARRACAEALATALLLATIVGSGIMGEQLAQGNLALALLGNATATGAMLIVLITTFGPVSGAHLNPAVSLAAAVSREITWRAFGFYALAQVAGAIAGAWCAHLMFDLPIMQISTKARGGAAQVLSEFVASFGLILTIFGCTARASASTPVAVGLYITGAYWFTASTSFANPAATIARMLTETFAGIAPSSVAPFIVAQFAGMLAGLVVSNWIWPRPITA